MTGEVKEAASFSLIDSLTLRSATPAGIEQRLHRLCRQFVGGVWLRVEPEQVVCRRIAGGLTNQLYHCKVVDDAEVSDDGQPHQVAIRLFGPKLQHTLQDDSRLPDAVLAVLMSRNKLGPKVFGVFDGGEILEYVEHHHFSVAEENDAEMVESLARSLARFHYLKAPFKKTVRFFDYLYGDFKCGQANAEEYRRIIEENNLEHLRLDLKGEIDFLKKCVSAINPKVVFTHNDFRHNNLLVTCDQRTGSRRIVVSDFEYAEFGFRGFDLGYLFRKWAGGSLTYSRFVPDRVLSTFLGWYNSECVALNGACYLEDARNSIASLLVECKIFFLVATLQVVLFFLKTENSPHVDQFQTKLLKKTNVAVGNYLEFKSKFINEGIISVS